MTANIIYTSQTDVIERQVRLARQQADFVVVGVHWGVEDSHAIVDSQRTLAQQLADWGADVIVGTHPHVLQDAQWLTAADGRRSFAAYSLGNFLSTQSRPDQLVGAILTLQLQKTTQPNGSVQCEVLARFFVSCQGRNQNILPVHHVLPTIPVCNRAKDRCAHWLFLHRNVSRWGAAAAQALHIALSRSAVWSFAAAKSG